MIGTENHTYAFRLDGEPEAVAALMSAMARAQAELENVAKNSENPAFRSRYADLGALLAEGRRKVAAEGVWISQPAVSDDAGRVGVQTVLAGHGATYSTGVLWQAIPDNARNASQEAGKAITYGRRYQLAAVLGLAQEDDDGNSMQGAPPARRSPQRQRQEQEPAQPTHGGALRSRLGAAGLGRIASDKGMQYAEGVADIVVQQLVAGLTLAQCDRNDASAYKALQAAQGVDLTALVLQAEADYERGARE